ncbi:protein KINESIN LIGHT CHAIN-RELATED 2-like [Silene latifolia]|uniref:protein KINESIN LIGHT CHAIN-RELATED 2-like n=1 Tax=Silene latifolia TaxID=37657 RepID=UPI003D78516F
MKRLSTKLISSSKITTLSTSISGNFTPQFTTCSSSSISKSPIQTLNPCSNSSSLFYKPYKTHQFYKTPSHYYSTHHGITPYYDGITPYDPEQSEIKKKMALIQEAVKAAKAAKSPEEMLEDFKKNMEDKFDKGELGSACMNIGLDLEKEGEDPQKIISFANRALTILDNVKNIYSVAMTLRLLGSTYCSLRKFNDALGFLNRARKILVKLENDGNYKYGVNGLKAVQLGVYKELVNVEAGMDRIKESVDYMRKCLEIQRCLMGVDSVEFGNANRDLAKMFVRIKNFKDGLLYCKKALEVHFRLLGESSVEVGLDRQVLGVIYSGMEELEKALEENELAQKIFKDCGCRSELIGYVVDVANLYIGLGRYEAAVNALKEHGKAVEEDSENPLILMTMGKALVYQDNFEEAKGCFVIACSVLDKEEEAKPLEVAYAYMTIAEQYGIMNDFETEVCFLMRVLSLLEKLPGEQHLEGGLLNKIGSLLLLMGKFTQAIPYLERAAETLKERDGCKHFGVGYIYNKLGSAYLELEKPESAAEMFGVAKDILDVSLGPHHNETIHTCENLSIAYAAMKSYPLAIEFQQKAVDAWEGHGHSAEDKLREARRLLVHMKVRARGASSKDCPEKALPLPHSSDASGGLQAP